jgi:GNAT superfamily N-acetyltransferase
MKHDDILHLGDLNLAEFIREMTRWNSAGEIIEQDDLLMTNCAGATPITNASIRLSRAGGLSAAEVIDRIQSFYASRSSGFSVHIRKHLDADLEAACQKENMNQISDAPGMIISEPVPDGPLPGQLELRQVTDDAGAADFATVAIDSYQSLGMAAEIGLKIFTTHGRCIKPYNYIVVGYLSGAPAGCAMVMMSHSIAGINWVGTIQSARGKGIAEACTRAVTNEALRRGAQFVVLQASTFGEPLYRRMGFREITRYPWYICV